MQNVFRDTAFLPMTFIVKTSCIYFCKICVMNLNCTLDLTSTTTNHVYLWFQILRMAVAYLRPRPGLLSPGLENNSKGPGTEGDQERWGNPILQYTCSKILNPWPLNVCAMANLIRLY